MATGDDQTWVQFALAGVVTMFGAVSTHLYTIGSSRSKAVFKKIEEEHDHVEREYVRKDVLAEVIRSANETARRQEAAQAIMSEQITDIARSLHVLMGRSGLKPGEAD